MTTSAQVVHYVPGRCRMRLPGMRGEADFFARLRADLLQEITESRVRVNALTGSVLVEGHATSLGELERIGRERGWFDLSVAEDREWAAPTAATGEATRRALMTVFLLLAVLQIARGQVLVPATSLLWYAFDMSTWSLRSA